MAVRLWCRRTARLESDARPLRPSSRQAQEAVVERWTVEQLAAAVDRTARAGGRSNARDEALALVALVKQELGAGASAEAVAAAAVRRASFGGVSVVRVAGVTGGEVVLGVNPEVLRELCRMLPASTSGEATDSLQAEGGAYTFAVQVLTLENAVEKEFERGGSSQLSAGHAARLVVGLIRECAATTGNTGLVQMLKGLEVVQSVQAMKHFLATFFHTNARGRRDKPRDTLVDAMLDVLEEGCEAMLARGGYTRGGEHPFLLDVQEAMHQLTVAAKHASSDEEALQGLRERLSKLQGAATDQARLKKLLSFRPKAAARADSTEQEAAGPEADGGEEAAVAPEADGAEEEAVGLTSHVQSALGPEAFRSLASEAFESIVDRLEGGEANASVLKVLNAVLVCTVKLVASDEERSQHAETGMLGRLKELHAEWRAARRRPAQRGAARRRAAAAAAAAGSAGGVALSKERSSSKHKREEEAARVTAVPDSGGEPSVQACKKGKKKVRAGGKPARRSRKAAKRVARLDSPSEEPSRAPSPTAAGELVDCDGGAVPACKELSEDSLVD